MAANQGRITPCYMKTQSADDTHHQTAADKTPQYFPRLQYEYTARGGSMPTKSRGDRLLNIDCSLSHDNGILLIENPRTDLPSSINHLSFLPVKIWRMQTIEGQKASFSSP
ncbi:hypothetical protein HNY73_012538 [Argiope bruennichi]|uniref:Uncharacterized protein n=1 Tax=Argiope bruennichi TaxID=94029 RepID=A0A8T0EV92_ARGBR|nr:hypothetical protein HNY73_012538 [Argiope bruennichi]